MAKVKTKLAKSREHHPHSGITSELSAQVNLLGSLLGEATKENAKPRILDLVEELRLACKAAETNQDAAGLAKIAAQLHQLPLDDLDWLLRIYTLFFNLINQAEIEEMIRINQQRSQQATIKYPQKESIASAIATLKEAGLNLQQVLKLINQLDIRFTLTAHPTEARRQTVLQMQRDISAALHQLNQPLNPQQHAELIDQIRQYILLLFYTDNIRSQNLTVADEVRNGLYYLRTTIWQTLPTVYDDLKFALKTYYDYEATNLPIIIRYHSWIGADCDGNPFVNSHVLQETLQRHQKAALKTIREALLNLRIELSISAQQVKIDTKFIRSLVAESKVIKLDLSQTRHFIHEPYRVKINYILIKIEAKLAVLHGSASKTQIKLATSYEAEDYVQDLLAIEESLAESGLGYLAQANLLQNIILQAKTFGFHLAELDIRQQSKVHLEVATEILRKKKIHPAYQNLPEAEKVKLLTQLLGSKKNVSLQKLSLSKSSQDILQFFTVMKKAPPKSLETYIISMTHHLSDVLVVLWFAKISGLAYYKSGKFIYPFNVVPLFETVDDLARINELLTSMYNNKLYRQHLRNRNNLQEVMLGYSDSNKDGGYWTANYLLNQAQSRVADISRQHQINFRIFHGRGGSAGRGGGRLYATILAAPQTSQTGAMRVTEQGEVITFHYQLNAMAHRHYEQTVYAMLIATAKINPEYSCPQHQHAIMQKIADLSCQTYRKLINHPDFWPWYIKVTPIEFISKLPIASRPVARQNTSEVDFNNLRAIPWVFSWTQTRCNVPAWFGIGQALQQVLNNAPDTLKYLQQLYHVWPFFKLIIDNIQQEMAKTHLSISQFYWQFSKEQSIVNVLLKEFELAKEYILKITEQDDLLANNTILQKSIHLRNPYTDVLNLLQVECMQRHTRAKNKKLHDQISKMVLLSINGLAGALQSTG